MNDIDLTDELELRAVIQELPLKRNANRVNQIFGLNDRDYA